MNNSTYKYKVCSVLASCYAKVDMLLDRVKIACVSSTIHVVRSQQVCLIYFVL